MNTRYSRIEQVEDIGPDGLRILHSSTAAILGLGNIGGEVARHLVMLGVEVTLVDRDEVTKANLGTQGFTKHHLGMSKPRARSVQLAELNPDCEINVLEADIEHLGLGALHGMDILFCCLDSMRARVVVNEIASRLGVPWVDAALDGSGKSLFGRVAAYDARSPASPCYVCPYDGQSLRDAIGNREDEGCPIWKWGPGESVTAPTFAISAPGAGVAAAQLIWGLRILLDGGRKAVGREIYLDLGRDALTTHLVARNPDCVFDHQVFSLTPLGRSVRDVTVADTFAEAEKVLGGGATFNVHRRSVATEIRCPKCDASRRPYRTLEALTPAEATCRCRTIMQPVALGLNRRFSKEEAHPFLNKTLEQLGLPSDDVVTIAKQEREVHLLISDEERETRVASTTTLQRIDVD